MDKELTTLFFSMNHTVYELTSTFKKTQLISFYSDGCELKYQLQCCIDDFEFFHKKTGVPLGKLLSNKYHLAKQMYTLSIALKKLGVKNIVEQQHLILNN
jgi:hypothetical protein